MPTLGTERSYNMSGSQKESAGSWRQKYSKEYQETIFSDVRKCHRE